jgi:hypothetical protein
MFGSEIGFIPPDELITQLPFGLGHHIVRREFTSRIQSGTVVFFDDEFTKECAFWRPLKGMIQFSDVDRTLYDYMVLARKKDVYAPRADVFSTDANEFMRYYRMAWSVRNSEVAVPSAPAYHRKPRARRSQGHTGVGY